jgi:hypothetical protein
VPLGCALVRRFRHPSFLSVAAAAAIAAISMAPPTYAQRADAGDWIETWTASPQPIWDAEFFAPINIPWALRNQTVRQIAAISIGGNRMRVLLSNEYGSAVALTFICRLPYEIFCAFLFIPLEADPLLRSNERSSIPGDEFLDRHGLVTADLSDVVIRAGEDAVMVINRNLFHMLDDIRVSRANG